MLSDPNLTHVEEALRLAGAALARSADLQGYAVRRLDGRDMGIVPDLGGPDEEGRPLLKEDVRQLRELAGRLSAPQNEKVLREMVGDGPATARSGRVSSCGCSGARLRRRGERRPAIDDDDTIVALPESLRNASWVRFPAIRSRAFSLTLTADSDIFLVVPDATTPPEGWLPVADKLITRNSRYSLHTRHQAVAEPVETGGVAVTIDAAARAVGKGRCCWRCRSASRRCWSPGTPGSWC